MDLYRYFHPHHNPRLRSMPLRLQELAELEQAALELGNAIKRAEVRATRQLKPDETGVDLQILRSAKLAAEHLVELLGELRNNHPGDDLAMLQRMLHERKDAPGWETWANLVRTRLALIEESSDEAAPAEPLSASKELRDIEK